MELSNDINNIITRILESENRWKALYMSTWGYSYIVKVQFENTENWDKPISFGLPASRNKQYIYKPSYLHKILTSKDGEFTIGHLQTLFSLFEEFLNESSKVLFNQEFDSGKWVYIKSFCNYSALISKYT